MLLFTTSTFRIFFQVLVLKIGERFIEYRRKSTSIIVLSFVVKKIYILYLHKSHNTPLLPPKNCIGIVLDYSWDIFMSQEKLQTMSMQNFWGVKEVHYGIVQVVNSVQVLP